MLIEILPVTLTPDEIRERGGSLAQVRDEVAQHEQEKKAHAEEFKQAVGFLESRSAKLVREIRSGIEYREVQVEEQKDYTAGECRTVRLDTGEVVHRRGLTPTELQRPLPLTPEPEQASDQAKADVLFTGITA